MFDTLVLKYQSEWVENRRFSVLEYQSGLSSRDIRFPEFYALALLKYLWSDHEQPLFLKIRH